MIHAVHANMLVLLLVTVGTLGLKWNTVLLHITCLKNMLLSHTELSKIRVGELLRQGFRHSLLLVFTQGKASAGPTGTSHHHPFHKTVGATSKDRCWVCRRKSVGTQLSPLLWSGSGCSG